ncbi:hypothetical protein HKX48_000963 [Thoreauomyces humboldtii]|nr:hypothetical protein HKX48_000963 [Thoreauomyces humboldtii]
MRTTVALAYIRPRQRRLFRALVPERGLASLANSSHDRKTATRPHQHFYLSGNFAPVAEEHDPIPLSIIKGKIPPCLQNGQFLRVGSNPRFVDDSRPHHWFDGDGMVHSVTFQNGQPHYLNKYVRTNKFAVESQLFGESSREGFNVNVSLATLGSGGRVDMVKALLHLYFVRSLTGIREGMLNTANTALTFFNGRLLALMEGSTPVHLHAGKGKSVQSIGQFDFDGQLSGKARAVTAHPKVCPETGEMMFFGYTLDSRPHLRYSVVDKDGKMVVNGLPIRKARACMAHDFAITRNHSIFMDLPLLADVQRPFVQGKPMIDFEPKAPSRFGIIPRRAKDDEETVWFELPEAGYAFHTANAWEEEEGRGMNLRKLTGKRRLNKHILTVIKLLACWATEVNLKEVVDTYRDTHPQLVEFKFDLTTRSVTKRLGSNTKVVAEFPQVDSRAFCDRPPFVFAARYSSDPTLSALGPDGLLKLDMDSGKVAELLYGPGVTGGEPVFVPRSSDAEVGDGYLLTFTHDEKTDASTFIVVSTRDMVKVAEFALPHRVPAGFHGMWLSEEQLMMQARPVTNARRDVHLPTWKRGLLRAGTRFLGR